jgi:hypothetical protein
VKYLPSGLSSGGRALLGWLALAFLGPGCKDYAYRHEVSGVVLTASGAPLASVFVLRVNSKNEPYGVPDLYQTKTDAAGHFEFKNEGRGPSPTTKAPWRIAVETPTKARIFYDVDAVWNATGTCTGYCATGLTLQIP